MPYSFGDLAGWKKDGTSRLAAESAAPKGEKRIKLIRQVMKVSIRPMTADEIAHATGIDLLSVRPTLTAMKKRRLIRDSGQHGISDRGKPMTRWELC